VTEAIITKFHKRIDQFRDELEKGMTGADVAKAQDLARACIIKNFKGC